MDDDELRELKLAQYQHRDMLGAIDQEMAEENQIEPAVTIPQKKNGPGTAPLTAPATQPPAGLTSSRRRSAAEHSRLQTEVLAHVLDEDDEMLQAKREAIALGCRDMPDNPDDFAENSWHSNKSDLDRNSNHSHDSRDDRSGLADSEVVSASFTIPSTQPVRGSARTILQAPGAYHMQGGAIISRGDQAVLTPQESGQSVRRGLLNQLSGVLSASHRLWNKTRAANHESSGAVSMDESHNTGSKVDDESGAFTSSQEQPGDIKSYNMRRFIFIMIGLCFLLAVAVGVGVGLAGGRSRGSTPNSGPTASTFVSEELAACLFMVNMLTADVTPDLLAQYEALANSTAMKIYPDFAPDFQSCEPKSLALLWLSNDMILTAGIVDDINLDLFQTRLLMAQLYVEWRGYNWGKGGGLWLTTESHCSWQGNACNTDSSITEIRLPKNNLVGTLPAELTLLSNLEVLELYENKIGGTLPAMVGLLSNLSHLDVSLNAISGPIPRELYGIGTLEVLSLAYNSLTGSISTTIVRLLLLKQLNLDSNQMAGSIPVELSKLTRLLSLGLKSNALTSTIPTELSSLSGLLSARVGGNNFAGQPIDLLPFWVLESLEDLFVHESNLYGTLPKIFTGLSNLEILDLTSNRVTGEVPTELSRCTKLQQLLLGTTKLTGPIPSELGSLVELEELSIYSNFMTGSVPQELCELRENFALRKLHVNCKVICACCTDTCA